MNKNYRNRLVAKDPTPDLLVGKYFPEIMIQRLVKLLTMDEGSILNL